MFDLDSAETRFALNTARRAAGLVRRIQSEMVVESLSKQDRSPVTVADFSSQALVGWLLSRHFPDDPLVAEEDSTVLSKSPDGNILEQVARYVAPLTGDLDGEAVKNWIDFNRGDGGGRFWTLDPVEGTKGFLRGDQYAVALALLVDGQVQVGVLGCPNLVNGSVTSEGGAGTLLLGVRGRGSWRMDLWDRSDPVPLKVSEEDNPARARLLRSFEAGHTNLDQIDHFVGALGASAEQVRMDSQAKYALLASGAGEIYLRLLSPSQPEYRERIWDQAAGSLILEEAGGRISDLDGKKLDFSRGRLLEANRGVLATNARLHEIALGALRDIGA